MSHNPQYLYRVLSDAVQARLNCQSADANESQREWADRWDARITQLVRTFMPSGSGWDRGTWIDLEASHASKLVFTGNYHHMNELGYYDGWTHHVVTVTPSFAGINIRVSGRDRNQIKDHLYETFDMALCARVVWDVEKEKYVHENATVLP
jgi:hypothetical protein